MKPLSFLPSVFPTSRFKKIVWKCGDFAGYFMNDISAIINILSHFKVCTEENIKQGYTQETYMNMIADRKKQLNELMLEFKRTLYNPEDYKVLGVFFEMKDELPY